MRQVGDYWIVLKCDGSPQCVVQIIGIEILPFNKVGPIFAASEGDGDLSLRYWRQGHMAQFKDQCKAVGCGMVRRLPGRLREFHHRLSTR